MTPQEEEILVRIIVQCVQTVLETIEQKNVSTQPELKQGSRFIDVVPQQEITNASALRNGRLNGHGREEMRASLRRFLRDSEPVIPEKVEGQSPQKRQLITREEVLAALRQGIKMIALQPGAVVTPLARQVAKEKGIELR